MPTKKTKEERREWFLLATYGSLVWSNKDFSLNIYLENHGECECGFSGRATARDVPRKYQFCNLYKKSETGLSKSIVKSICRECVINQVDEK